MDIFESIYERFEESGLPPKSFCFNEGILPDRFYDWRRKLLGKRGEFIPVKINGQGHLRLPYRNIAEFSCRLADLAVGKYVDLLPLNRQIEMFKRAGVYLPPPTVNGWIRETADLLRPLHFGLQELVMETDYLQSDETTIPVIRDERHKTVKRIYLACAQCHGRAPVLLLRSWFP
jgi:hypothetical protein